MKDVSFDQDGKFRASDKYKSPNIFIVEGLEYLALMLRKTNEEDKKAKIEQLRLAEIASHKKKMDKIKSMGTDGLKPKPVI